jgi:hypothetical protein
VLPFFGVTPSKTVSGKIREQARRSARFEPDYTEAEQRRREGLGMKTDALEIDNEAEYAAALFRYAD